ncbi:MAG: PQQ-binding-like beta-propeller repeat protein [Hadesarchaea archaeon]|nr:PQQ-binding-like beta-propeller repeat protein [Hadesarchaea archaeon]
MGMKFGMVIVAVLLLGLVLSPASGAESSDNQEWPTFKRDWSRAGYVDVVLPDELELLWEFPGEWDIIRSQSSPVVAGGRVYFTAENMQDNYLYIYALDAENGELLWSYRTGWGGSPAEDPTPTVVGGKVYVGSWDNYFYCLDDENGDLIWSFHTGRKGYMSGVDGAPVVVNNRVYFGCWSGYFYCLNAKTGDLIWSFSDGDGSMGHAYGAPAFADGMIFFATAAGAEVRENGMIFDYTGWVYALNADDGALIWKFYIGDEAQCSVAVVDNRLYVGFGFMGHLPGDGMWAFDAHTGELLWYFDTENKPAGAPAIAHGKVYFGCDDGYVYSLDAENSSVVWRYQIGGLIFSSPIVVGKKILIGNGNLNVFDAETGELLSVFGAGTVPNSPAFAYGKVYFIDYAGGMKALVPIVREPPALIQPWLVVLAFTVVGIVIIFSLIKIRY